MKSNKILLLFTAYFSIVFSYCPFICSCTVSFSIVHRKDNETTPLGIPGSEQMCCWKRLKLTSNFCAVISGVCILLVKFFITRGNVSQANMIFQQDIFLNVIILSVVILSLHISAFLQQQRRRLQYELQFVAARSQRFSLFLLRFLSNRMNLVLLCYISVQHHRHSDASIFPFCN